MLDNMDGHCDSFIFSMVSLDNLLSNAFIFISFSST